MRTECSSPYACDETSHPGLPYYCARHAREAGLPVHPESHGVIVRGARLVEREEDFAFDPTYQAGERFRAATTRTV